MTTDRHVTAIDNFNNAVPQDSHVAGGLLRCTPWHYAKVAADVDGFELQVARVPSNAIMASILLSCDAITGFTALDIGLCNDKALGSHTVHSVNCYADAQTLASALTLQELLYEGRDINLQMNRVWQDAGLTSDPGGHMRVLLTGETAGANAGDLSGQVRYITS